jgi:signal recognition particle subunit SRP54
MGGLGGILKSLPGAGKLKDVEGQIDEKELDRIEAIIFSMTPSERRNPKLLNGSRRERIAKGSGSHVSDVNRLLKQFAETRKLMKQMQGMTGKGRKRMKLPGFPGLG